MRRVQLRTRLLAEKMTDLRPQIAIKLRLAAHAHAKAFPAGDWRAVNARLGELRIAGMRWEPSKQGMGNAMCADYLQAGIEAEA